ncbi:MAG: hypothetical protein K8T89_15825 [Planctomycetes bacterium]|nr:hypothetical protein [Planctomycetota bacterium]
MRLRVVCLIALFAFTLFVVEGDRASAQLKKLKTGTTIGELKTVEAAKNKRDTIVEVLAPGEIKPRHYTVGAQQREVLALVKAAKIGERVEIEWYDTVERLCVDKFQVLKTEKRK